MKRFLTIAALCAAAAVYAGQGVVIDSVTWATCNVGDPGKFVDNPKDHGRYYTFAQAQEVCPDGWRTPSKEEFTALEKYNSTWTRRGRTFGKGDNTIFLPAAGGQDGKSKAINNRNTRGNYWSSDRHEPGRRGGSERDYLMYFNENRADPASSYSDWARFSVRCVKL